jgi:hypothetical protein
MSAKLFECFGSLYLRRLKNRDLSIEREPLHRRLRYLIAASCRFVRLRIHGHDLMALAEDPFEACSGRHGSSHKHYLHPI